MFKRVVGVASLFFFKPCQPMGALPLFLLPVFFLLSCFFVSTIWNQWRPLRLSIGSAEVFDGKCCIKRKILFRGGGTTRRRFMASPLT